MNETVSWSIYLTITPTYLL